MYIYTRMYTRLWKTTSCLYHGRAFLQRRPSNLHKPKGYKACRQGLLARRNVRCDPPAHRGTACENGNLEPSRTPPVSSPEWCIPPGRTRQARNFQTFGNLIAMIFWSIRKKPKFASESFVFVIPRHPKSAQIGPEKNTLWEPFGKVNCHVA